MWARGAAITPYVAARLRLQQSAGTYGGDRAVASTSVRFVQPAHFEFAASPAPERLPEGSKILTFRFSLQSPP
jgi:hypothetical protein